MSESNGTLYLSPHQQQLNIDRLYESLIAFLSIRIQSRGSFRLMNQSDVEYTDERFTLQINYVLHNRRQKVDDRLK